MGFAKETGQGIKDPGALLSLCGKIMAYDDGNGGWFGFELWEINNTACGRTSGVCHPLVFPFILPPYTNMLYYSGGQNGGSQLLSFWPLVSPKYVLGKLLLNAYCTMAIRMREVTTTTTTIIH